MMEAIWNALIDFADWIFGLVKKVFLAVWDFFVDAVCLVLDKVLQWGVDMIASLNVSSLQLSQSWSGLPADVLNIIGLCGLGQCMVIIGAAIAIRLALQLIPFVRLGS